MDHDQQAKLVRDEFEKVIGSGPPYPSSRGKVKQLKNRLTKVNIDESQQPVIQKTFYTRSKIR